jgi:hypothetical protein
LEFEIGNLVYFGPLPDSLLAALASKQLRTIPNNSSEKLDCSVGGKMLVSSRTSARLAVAVSLLFAFAGFASPEQVGSTATACSCQGTTSASTTDIRKAEKEVDRAQADVAKACQARQRAAMKAERSGDQAKANAKLEKYNAILQKRQCELSQAQARLNSLQGNTAVARNSTEETQTNIAEAEPAPVAPAPAPSIPETEQPQSNLAESAPPAPAPSAPSTESTQSNQPTQSIASNSEPQNTEPRELPRTAGSLDLLGLVGLLSMGGYFTTFLRR